MELEYEGHVSSKNENGDEDGLYESSLLLCESEPTVSIPIATSRIHTVNCKYGKPVVGSPEELVEAESYTEPDKREELLDQDTVVVEAYPTVDYTNGKEGAVQSQEWTEETQQQRSFIVAPTQGTRASSRSMRCLRDFSSLCSIIQNENGREDLLLLCELLGVESNTVTDVNGLKERILSFSIRQPLDAFNLQRVESKLKQWDWGRMRKLASLLQISEEDENKLVESIVQRLDNLESWSSQQEEEELPKKKKKRTNSTSHSLQESSVGCSS
ncbi:hypothetical protein GpartN1_g7176.t1 [Galdieria partita]|uniref:Uncharacterized protein n=1 Tax=Galdieria partita TaxID=83374 RepID=A0A9C7UUB6_9RHOD|nr:hypothetical protein GpartN1_g7176.t1 [Galdieria partita]